MITCTHTHNRSPFYCTFREWKNIQTKCSEELETKQKKTTGETERTREQMNERQLRNSCYDLVYLLFACSQNLMNEWIACQSWQSIEENDEAKIKWIVSLVWYGSLIVLYIFTLVSLSFAPLSHSAFSSLEFARDSIDQLIIIIFLIQFNSVLPVACVLVKFVRVCEECSFSFPIQFIISHSHNFAFWMVRESVLEYVNSESFMWILALNRSIHYFHRIRTDSVLTW